MPRGINPDSPCVRLNLTLERKKMLTRLAEENGCDTISQFIAQIADRRLVVIDKVAAVLVDRIIEDERAKGKRI